MKPVDFHEDAKEEIHNQIRFLETRTPGLGRRFLAEVVKASENIGSFPEVGAEVIPGIRKRTLKRFPHSLFYVEEETRILVLAVSHQRQRPSYWHKRRKRRR